MNVLIISTRIYPDSGGPAVFAYRFGVKLVQTGSGVHILSATPPKNSECIPPPITNLQFHHLPIRAPPIEEKGGILFKILFLVLFILLGVVYATYIVKKYKISICHVHSPYPSGIIAFFLKIVKKIPYTYLIHGADYEEKLNKWIEAEVIQKYADKSFLIARYLEEFLPRNHPWELISNAIDPTPFYKINTFHERAQMLEDLNILNKIRPADFIFLYIGNMTHPAKFKGMADFIIAFEKFLKQISPKSRLETKLIFVGDGQFRKNLQNLVQQKKLEQNVIFLGKRSEIPQLCSLAHVGALISYKEGMPNVLLEMMAASVPCIGSDVGEVRELIGDTGFIVNPGDFEAITSYLVILYNDPELLLQLGKKARERIENRYTWDIVLQTYDKANKFIFSRGLKRP